MIIDMLNAKAIYESTDGRWWVIDEMHPQSDATFVVAREYKSGHLMHTCIWGRADLRRVRDLPVTS